MSHSIAGKGQATKDCTACHAKDSILHRPLDLDNFLPKGVPTFFQGRKVDVVSWQGQGAGASTTGRCSRSFYVIGNSRVAWIEWLGWLSVAGALLFALIHGGVRILGGRK